MLFKRICLLLIYSGLLLFLSSACGDSNNKALEIGDGGLLSGKPCSAPCFWGIIPGSTTQKQALSILSSKLNINNCDSWDTRNSGGTRGIQCSNIGIDFDGQNLVNGVGFSPTQKLTINDVMLLLSRLDGQESWDKRCTDQSPIECVQDRLPILS
jgi:hypothetical protein